MSTECLNPHSCLFSLSWGQHYGSQKNSEVHGRPCDEKRIVACTRHVLRGTKRAHKGREERRMAAEEMRNIVGCKFTAYTRPSTGRAEYRPWPSANCSCMRNTRTSAVPQTLGTDKQQAKCTAVNFTICQPVVQKRVGA